MNNIKMSDVFDLPIKSVSYQNQIKDSKGSPLLFSDLHDYEKDAICEAINDRDRLIEENNRLKLKLLETAQELHCMIDMKNAEIERGISCNDLDEPDYFDHQTVHEAMVLVRGDNNE